MTKDRPKKQLTQIPLIERNQCGYCMSYECRGDCSERRHFWNDEDDEDGEEEITKADSFT